MAHPDPKMRADISWAHATQEFGRTLRQARIIRDSLPPRDAARLAYTPGGLSVEEIEELIIRQRAEARSALPTAA